MSLFYSADAIADLVRLRAFIAQKNLQAASRIARQLVERIVHLQAFPEMDVSVPESPDPGTVRDMVFSEYVVRYARRAETIFILRIWHGREDREREV